MLRRTRSLRQRGQAVVEFAMLVPVLALLLVGTFDGSLMATNQLGAYGAVRHGARLGAQLGGYGTPGVVNPPCYGTIPGASAPADSTVDNAILADVLSVAFERIDTNAGNKHLTGLNYVDVTKVVIYRKLPNNNAVTNIDGVYVGGTDHANVYNITKGSSGGITQPTITNAANSPGFPLSERCQGPLTKEVDLGIEITYKYYPQNHITDGLATFVQFKDYAVEKMALCESNCLP